VFYTQANPRTLGGELRAAGSKGGREKGKAGGAEIAKLQTSKVKLGRKRGVDYRLAGLKALQEGETKKMDQKGKGSPRKKGGIQ